MTASAISVPQPPQLGGLVLIVDDDVGLQETLCDILQSAGVEANAVGSATAATAWCDGQNPDLVVLDQRLPDASGLQLAALLKARSPMLPVVLLTGYVSTDTAIAAVGLVDDYLTKPVPPNELIKVVHARLDQRRLRLANQELLNQLQETNNRLESTVQERTRELRAARDEALEGSRLKSQFLANMSHEIRTPMNGVLGAANLLATTGLSAEQRQYVDILTTSGRALLAIINDVLDFSKIEAGHVELERATFSLHDLFSALHAMFEPQAAEKGLQLTFDVASEVPDLVVGDAGRLRQVLVNLIGNAVKFTDSGGVRVTAAIEMSADNVSLRCEVTDTGIGVSEKDIPRLFSDFTQADASMTRRFGGTGLGLAISDRLVRMMDGAIGCTPGPDGGSTFWFTVSLSFAPTQHAAETPFAGRGGVDTSSDSRGTGPVVLVVEDNEINAVILARMLAILGYRAELVRSGADALAAVGNAKFAAILMDCQMPVMDGFTTTRMLRERERERDGDRLPIIAITATATTEDQSRCFDAGMDDYLPKPIIMERLVEALERWAPIRA
ncbi:MAG TPA: response regulator [Acidothermaceae bacterium]|nr:response regulator [Acidothermaceae bacterium]